MSLSWADRLARLAQQIDNAGVIESTALPPSQGGAHPDLAAHVTLGLAGTHAHPYSSDVHAHAGVYEPVHTHPYAGTGHNHDASYAPTHSHPYEASGAVTTHEAAPNPHAAYATDADLSAHALTPHGGGTWTAVIKTADESKNNLATVADDALLRFTTLANTSYVIRLRAFFLTNATADLKYRLVHGGTTTRVRRLIRRTATTDIAQTIALLTAFDAADVVLSTTGLNPWLEEEIVLQVGASGGLFRLQWAQVTSNAGPTTCLEGSYLEYALT